MNGRLGRGGLFRFIVQVDFANAVLQYSVSDGLGVHMKRAALALICALSACGSVNYEDAKVGKLKGSALVLWVGSGEESALGNGKFLYVPLRDKALSFERGANVGASQTITPEAFYTDGGSIPRVVQTFPGFAAWGYGPAYIIHDWLFVARRCLNRDRQDQTDTASAEMKKLAEMTFNDSAVVLAESIKTLAADFDLPDQGAGSGAIISSFTAGPVSYRLWNEIGPCENRLEPAHQEFVDQLNAQSARESAFSLQFDLQTRPTRLSNGETVFLVDFIEIE
jgi:uncharacterized protein DUF1353